MRSSLIPSWNGTGRAPLFEPEVLAAPGPSGKRAALAPLPALAFPPGYRPGRSEAFAALYADLLRLTRGDLPVLLIGETGVGKDALARALHATGARRRGPFVAINCGAIPQGLEEAELLGIVEGMATGVRARPGLLREAEGGVLFLDEVGEMPLALQAKLLRVLEGGTVRPIGGRPLPIDVRVVAATHVDLAAAIRDKRFRADLYYRLAGFELLVPPLRETPEDLPGLATAFLEQTAGELGLSLGALSPEALALLRAAPWPGNVRELAHVMRRVAYLADDGEVIGPALLARAMPRRRGEDAPTGAGLDVQLAALERRLIGEALAATKGVQLEAARRLGIHRNSLAKKMRRLGFSAGESDERRGEA